MSRQKNLMTLCFASVFTLGLAACGGGGGGDAPVAGMMDGDDTDDTTTSSLVGKVFPDGTMFMLPAGLVEDITVSVEEGASVPVPGVGIFECVTGPCTIAVASDVVTTTGVIGVVSLAEGLPAEVLTALASNTEDAPAGPTPATAEQMTADAATKVKAIDKEAGQDTAAGLGGTGATTYSMDIKRDRDGTTVEIKDTANAGDDDPEFIKQDVNLGVGRTMHVRVNSDDEDGKVEEVVIVETDIKAPKATLFVMVADQGLNARDLDDDVDADKNGTANDDFTALMVDQAASAVAEGEVDVRKLIKSAALSSGATSFAFDVESTTDTDEAFETEGTYNGAPGKYRCDAVSSDCTVSVDPKGAITSIVGGWVFTPDRGAKSQVADTDYLQYGFWLMRTKKDGATTYNEVETFAEAIGFGDEEPTPDGLGAVTGDATYEGGSVGVYVKNVLDDQANIASATSGHFSADVELTANFSGGDVPLNNHFTIGGTITKFVLSGGEENDWAVKLGLADFSTRTVGDDPGESMPGSTFTPMFSGVATGDSTALAGSWNGMFHGEAGMLDHDGDEATPVVNTPPAAVVGEFNANFTNGTAAGGFGANKQ